MNTTHYLLRACLFILLASAACALDSQHPLADYSRTQWTAEDGFRVGQVSSITQTADGYLWVGGENGLVSFDGQNFHPFPSSAQSSITHVLGLTSDAQGALWAWMQGANVLRYNRGALINVTNQAGLPDATVTAMSRGMDGSVLLSTLGQQIFESKAGRITKIAGTTDPNTLMLSITKTGDGRVWIGTRDTGLAYIQGGRILSLNAKNAPKKINSLLPGRANTLWIGADEGLFFWNGSQLVRLQLPESLRHAEVLSMVLDRDSNLWCGTADGLFRISSVLGSQAKVAAYLPKQNITALFEDREGDLWIGTARNLQRWKDRAFQSYTSGADQRDASGGPVYVDEHGTAWLGSSKGGLYRIDDGRLTQFEPGLFGADVVYSIAGRDNDVWVGRQAGGLTHLSRTKTGAVTKTFNASTGLAQNTVFSVLEAQDGTVWAGTLSAGLSEFKDGKWKTYTTVDGLPSNTVSAIAEGPHSDLWVGTPGGLALFSNGRWRTFTQRDGLPSGEITSLLSDGDAGSNPVLWVGTARGLAIVRPDRVQTIHSDADVLQQPIWGIANDVSGSLWLSTPNQLARVSEQKLFEDHVDSTGIRSYGRSDGIEEAGGVRRTRSLVTDKDGNIWASTTGGVAAVTPTYMRHPAAASIVHIEAIVADGVPVNITSPKIPDSRRRLIVDYNALNLSAPERIRFRYRLDGFDKDWSDPVAVRQAVYTHLDPGSYRFRVIASNGEGSWNSGEASVQFDIEPAVWQTWWFRLLCLSSVLLLCWCAYLVRMRQIATRNSIVFEERLAERMRIAQELHDTLLQSFHALMLRFQAVSNLLPERPQQAKEQLEVAIDRAADALTESRDAVQKLRTRAVGSSDLVEALTRFGHELAEAHSATAAEPSFRVLVEGSPRPINPIVRDELYRIGREAIGNAFRHAHANHIEVELGYDSSALSLRVRDDGVGIDRQLLNNGGRAGHWGLPGMRERARSLGGQLGVWSELRRGTEVELTIPGSIAYNLMHGQDSSDQPGGERTVHNDA